MRAKICHGGLLLLLGLAHSEFLDLLALLQMLGDDLAGAVKIDLAINGLLTAGSSTRTIGSASTMPISP